MTPPRTGRISVLALALTAGACTTDTPTEMLAYRYVGDGAHDLGPVPLGVVEDPVHMRTSVGGAFRGGRVAERRDVAVLEPGSPVYLLHDQQDGLFVPLDEEGLVLTSFFHDIGETWAQLDAMGLGEPLDALFPLSGVLWNPAIGSDLGTVENAAYLGLPGINAFILFADANREVPLGANAAVVRHELGHAYLAHLVPAFDPDRVEALFTNTDLSGYDHRAMHEGFADIFSLLTLDDAGAMPFGNRRDPREPRTLDDVDSSDPYSVGVILAAFAWDVRVQVDDAEVALRLVLDAMREWDRRAWAEELPSDSALAFGEVLLQTVLAAEPATTTALCADYARHYLAESPSCP